MSGTSVLTIALALSTLVHTGLATALYYAPLVKTDLFLHRRPRPVALDFEVTSKAKDDTDNRPIKTPTTPVDTTVPRPKRRRIKKRSPVVTAELRPKPPEKQNPLEEPVEDKPIDASLNPDAFQISATAEPTAPAFSQQTAAEAHAASAVTSVSARSNAGISASAKARRAPSKTHWNSIRSAIEKYVEYPRVGRRFGWAGKVILRFKLMADGRVLEARVDKSSGFALLDQSALKALKRAAPLPRPETATEITVPILFALR